MAATSPYQNNDYQAVSNYRPYELPANDVFKAISAQNQFWEESAKRIKSVYDNALNLKLSLQPNREIRDNFMREAEKEIDKLNDHDISAPSVQRQAFSIFKPLFQDEGVMYDDAMTRHYEKVREEALQYRTIDDGKGYSDTNLSYAMDGYNDFITSQDRMAGKKFFQNRKDYTPFYDPTSEINGILKNCKPSTASAPDIQGMYIRSYSNESLTASKINTCLDGGLSDRAKRQLQINGAVTYKNNPEALKEKYIPHLQGTRTMLGEQKAALLGVLANKENLKSLKKEELAKLGISDISQITPDLIRSMQENVSAIEGREMNINNTISKLLANDLSPIMGKDFEPIAGMIYSRDYMQNVAEGYSYDFAKNDIKVDPAQMMFYQQNQLNARQEDDQKHEREMKEMELNAHLMEKMMGSGSYSLKGMMAQGALTGDMLEMARTNNDTTSPFATIDKTDSYDQVTGKIQELVTKRTELNNWFTKELRGMGMPNYASNSPEEKQFIANFRLTAGSDPTKAALIAKYESQMDNYIALGDLYKNTIDNVDKALKPSVEILNRKIQELPSIEVAGRKITPQDIIDARNGRSKIGLTVQNKKYQMTSGSMTAVTSGSDAAEEVFYLDGKRLSPNGFSEEGKVKALANDITRLAGEQEVEIRKRRNELMQKETVLQKEGYNFQFLNDEKSPFKLKLASELGIPKEGVSDLIIGQTDANGRVIVKLNKSTKEDRQGYDYAAAFEKLKKFGGADNKVINEGNGEVMLVNVSQLDMIDENNLSQIMAPYIRSIEGKVTPNKNESTGYIRSAGTAQYRLEVGRSFNGGYDYKIISIDKPTSPVAIYSDREEALRYFQSILQKK